MLRIPLYSLLLSLLIPSIAGAANSEPELGLRFGRHDGFERIVLDWNVPVSFEVREAHGLVAIEFDRAASDVDRTATGIGGEILRMRSIVPGEGRSEVTLELTEGARFRCYRLDGDRIVVDAFSPVTPTPRTPQSAMVVRTATTADDGAMQRALYRRDMMIASLLERVEQLEQRTGSRPARAARDAEATSTSSATGGEVVLAAGSDGSGGGIGPAVDDLVVERALERALTRAGSLLLPAWSAELTPSLAYSRVDRSAPAFVDDGGGNLIFLGEEVVERDIIETGLDLRAGLPYDSQFEIGLPFLRVEEERSTRVAMGTVASEGSSGSGIGDLRIGLAKTLAREDGWRPDLVGRVWWDSDTGRERDGDVRLSDGFHELGVSLAALKRQDPLAFSGSIFYADPLENNGVEPGSRIGFNIGAVLAASPETSLRVAFSQQHIDDTELDGITAAGSDRTVASVTLGASAILGGGAFLDAGLEIGLTDDAPDYVARISVPVRFDIPRLW